MSDLAIETALTLRRVFHRPLRQTEGFVRSLLRLMTLALEALDHTTLSRRAHHLNVHLRCQALGGPLHLFVDSSGLAIVGEAEWAAARHGGNGKRGWKKLQLGVDRSGVIVAQILIDGTEVDAASVSKLIDQIEGDLRSFTADRAYDTSAVYRAAGARGARVVVPPTKTTTSSRRRRRRCSPRRRTIERVQRVGRREWKKESGHHREARVEIVFFRYRSILSDRLRSRDPGAQRTEATTACNILNRMTELDRPAPFAVRRLSGRGRRRCRPF